MTRSGRPGLAGSFLSVSLSSSSDHAYLAGWLVQLNGGSRYKRRILLPPFFLILTFRQMLKRLLGKEVSRRHKTGSAEETRSCQTKILCQVRVYVLWNVNKKYCVQELFSDQLFKEKLAQKRW